MITPQILIQTETSRFWVAENFTDDYLEQLQTLQLDFEPPIMIRGQMKHQRRNVGFYSDLSEGYHYSQQKAFAKPLTPFLSALLSSVNSSLSTNFNGLLINSYANGEKYLSAHSDDERSLDKSGRNMVAGLAYGATRTFRIRDKKSGDIVLDYEHTPRTLIVMEGDFQKEFTHEIPIRKRVKEERISVTFREHAN